MGFFDRLKKKTDTNTINCGPVTLSYSIEVKKNPIYERIAALHREAEKYKKVDLPAAVICLKKATNLMRQHPGSYSLTQWTRLPVFMQQAGQFDDAMQEFERLLSEVENRVRQECLENASAVRIEYIVNLNYQKIYDKMRMACKRQKRLDKAAEYVELSRQHSERVAELQNIVNQELKDERNAVYVQYAKNRLKQLRDPDLLKSCPYWKYISNKTMMTPCHQQWDGLVLRHDDPWWQNHFPPNDTECQCRVTAVWPEEYTGQTAPLD